MNRVVGWLVLMVGFTGCGQPEPEAVTFRYQLDILPVTLDPMQNLARYARRFWSEEDGTAAVEYAVLLALIIVTAMPAITALGEHVRDIYIEVADSLPDASINL